MIAVKRFLGILLNIVSVLLLALCAATLILWIRGGSGVVDLFSHFHETRTSTSTTMVLHFRQLQLGGDAISINRDDYAYVIGAPDVPFWSAPLPSTWRYDRASPNSSIAMPNRSMIDDLKFLYRPDRSSRPGFARTGYCVRLPYRLLLPFFATAPGWRLIRHARRRQLLRLGFCSACGYDLRATPDRCPECGTPARR
jgi:hypothetical protein